MFYFFLSDGCDETISLGYTILETRNPRGWGGFVIAVCTLKYTRAHTHIYTHF